MDIHHTRTTTTAAITDLCLAVLRCDAASDSAKAHARDLMRRANPDSLGSIFGGL